MKRRILAGVVASVAVIAIGYRSDNGTRPTSNGSTDGKLHTCGYVTEDGVTENLDAYHARCGSMVN